MEDEWVFGERMGEGEFVMLGGSRKMGIYGII